MLTICAIASAVTAIGAVSAYAAKTDSTSLDVSYDSTANAMTVTPKSTTTLTGQTAIVVIKGDYQTGTKATVVPDEANIIYINQAAATTATAAGGFLATGGVLPSAALGTATSDVYTIRVGYAGQSGFYSALFYPNQAASSRLLGNVNDDTKINVSDIVGVVNHISGTTYLHDDKLQAADGNDDAKVNVSDIVAIANYISGTASTVDGKKTVADKTKTVTDDHPVN